MSRSSGVDLVTGDGLAGALAGVECVIDVATRVFARVLRAAQFHEFVGQLVGWGRRGDVSYVPRMRIQPVAARTVAKALVDVATAPVPAPTAPISEIAGPREEQLVDLATRLAARRADPVRVEAVSDPADPDRGKLEIRALLPGPHATIAGPTFEEWLDSTS